jgi:hypothetical protein
MSSPSDTPSSKRGAEQRRALLIEPGTEDGWLVIDAAVRSARDRLGDGLLSAYAIGSLAHGGFSPAVSDVDLALLTDHADAAGDVRGIVAQVLADTRGSGHALAERLSIFHAPWAEFGDPPPDARFPPIDRYDLVHFGILVDGADHRARYGVAPTASEIREHAVASALGRVSRAQLADDLRRIDDGSVTVHDATTGNAAAVDHYLRLAPARHRSLVRDAFGWRKLSRLDDPRGSLRRIADEIHDLHAEVFTRLADRPDLPRRDELARRGHELTA